MTTGALITFEGIEGCGKSTQAERFFGCLLEKNVDAVFSREPGGTELGEKIRDILLDPGEDCISPDAELFLFNAARAQIVAEIVTPAIRAGRTVILDRYIHSTLAYQGYGNDPGTNGETLSKRIERIRRICYEAASGIWPNVVFLIDVPVEVGMERIAGRERDGIEKRGPEFHRRVRDGFLDLAKAEPDIFEVIDGTESPDNVFGEIKRIAGERLLKE